MSNEGSLNGRIDETFRMREAASLSVRGINKSTLAVTELKYDGYDFGLSDPVVREDAFLVGLQLRPYALHQLWFEGKEVPVYNVRAGDTLFFDQKSVEAARMDVPFHSLMFYLPRNFLDELADDFDVPRIDQLRPRGAVPVSDPVIESFGRSVQPALATPTEANELFASHLMLAFGAYVCATYGGLRSPKGAVGGLSRWQERAAKELIDAHIDGSLSLQDMASVVGLSASRLAHAFKSSVGISPNRWLLQRRVERAKTMLRQANATLVDIAFACGFADQSHFTRVFSRATGLTPARWRQLERR